MSLTNDDLQKINSQIETALKNNNQAILTLLQEQFVTKNDVRSIVKEEVGLLPTREEFFDRMDKLSGEIITKREEQITHSGQHVDINDKFEIVGSKLNLNLSY